MSYPAQHYTEDLRDERQWCCDCGCLIVGADGYDTEHGDNDLGSNIRCCDACAEERSQRGLEKNLARGIDMVLNPSRHG